MPEPERKAVEADKAGKTQSNSAPAMPGMSLYDRQRLGMTEKLSRQDYLGVQIMKNMLDKP